MPTTVPCCIEQEGVMSVMIGVDPHKGSHTAVAVDGNEECVGQLRVRSGTAQVNRLLAWAVSFPERTWAIENAAGLGYLLAQQLVASGEWVVNVQPKLAARVRLLATEATNKNDPHDARSVAIAALRSTTPRAVRAADHTAVLRLWVRRHRDLARASNQLACRLDALICDLVAGGVVGEIHAGKVDRLLEDIEPNGPVAAARTELATELLTDLRHLDEQLANSKKRLAAVVAASKTTTTDIFGVGPVVAAMVVGITGDIGRFANVTASPPSTAPHPSRSPPAPARSTGSPDAATANSTTPSTSSPSARSATATTPAASSMTARSPKARPPKKPSAPSNDASATPSTAVYATTPEQPPRQPTRVREGNRGTTLTPARPAHTPQHRLFGQATPEPRPTLRHPPKPPEEPLDKQRGLDPEHLGSPLGERVGAVLRGRSRAGRERECSVRR
jgi:transposase